ASRTGLEEGSTIHSRAVAQSAFVTVRGGDQTLDVVNLPPAFSLGDLAAKVHLRKLGRDRVLGVPVQLSEPATVDIELERRHKVVRQLTAQAPAGTSLIPLSLKHLRRGRYTLRLVATDAEGGAGAPVVSGLRLVPYLRTSVAHEPRGCMARGARPFSSGRNAISGPAGAQSRRLP